MNKGARLDCGRTIELDGEAGVARFGEGIPVKSALRLYLQGASARPEERLVAEDISVIVPVYNTELAYLHCCIDSLFRQTVAPARIIVVDDGSSRAETLDYLEALGDAPGIEVVRNDRNLSLGPTMNCGLRRCRTAYALKLDSDDIALPEMVACFGRSLVDSGPVDVLGCQFTSFGDSRYTTAHPWTVTKRYVLSSPGYWFVNHTGVMVKRDSVLAVGGYRSMRGFAEDYELWVRMILRGYNRFRNLPQSLVRYRDREIGLHKNFKRYGNRLMLTCLKQAVRLAPSF